MRKEFIMILLAIMVIISAVLWFTSTTSTITLGEVAMYGGILLIVGFALFVAFQRIRAAKAGLKPEDELSKKILQKTAAMSYYTSLYWLLILIYYSDKTQLESHSLLGVGILGMAIFFGGFWVYNNYWGKFNE